MKNVSPWTLCPSSFLTPNFYLNTSHKLLTNQIKVLIPLPSKKRSLDSSPSLDQLLNLISMNFGINSHRRCVFISLFVIITNNLGTNLI